MTNKETLFCKLFVKTFDFNGSCEQAKLNKKLTLVKLYDTSSELNTEIREQVDIIELQNNFLSEQVVYNKLYQIVLSGDDQHKIQAAKIILGIDKTSDQSTIFKELVDAMKKGD